MRHVQALLSTFLLFAFLFSPTALAQDEEGDDEPPHSLAEDAWALQFRVSDNFILGSFQGSTISFKRHTSAAHAWQIGLTLGGSYSNTNFGEGYGNEDRSSNSQNVGLVARYLTYPLLEDRPLESIQLYAGAGPEVSFFRSKDRDLTRGPGGNLTTRVRTSANLEAGVSAAVGAEWFVKERISLSASYSSGLFYTRRLSENDDSRSERERTSNGVRLGLSRVDFGLSVYF